MSPRPDLETINVTLYEPMRDLELCPVQTDERGNLCPNRARNRLEARIMGGDTVLSVYVCDAHALRALDVIARNAERSR